MVCTPPPQKRTGLWFHIFDVLLNIVIIMTVVGGIRTFLISPFQVEGSSMIDTLEDNQYIIINKLAYYLGKPNRGDVVVFRPPNDRKKYYVKRIIGLPGDTVILRNGQVYIDSPSDEEDEREVEEMYLNEANRGKTYRHPPGSGDASEMKYTVTDGHYFVLGDNRQGSLDSRSFVTPDSSPIPFVQEDDIKGKVWFIALPIKKIHALAPPGYGSLPLAP